MSNSETQLAPESGRSTVLDTMVKYAGLLTWLVFVAGVTRISGFLSGLSVPIEAGFFYLPAVVSYGGSTILTIVECAALGLVARAVLEKDSPRFAKFLEWTAPTLLFISQEHYLLRAACPVSLRVRCGLYLLAAIYLCIALAHSRGPWVASRTMQAAVALSLFFLVSEGSGYIGDIEAYLVRDTPPHIQLLLAPEAVPGASKFGLTFSASAPGLSDPVNVVAVSEKMYYVWLPSKLSAEVVSEGAKLNWGNTTVAIPRDRVLLASVH
jgi:hypothetical protein